MMFQPSLLTLLLLGRIVAGSDLVNDSFDEDDACVDYPSDADTGSDVVPFKLGVSNAYVAGGHGAMKLGGEKTPDVDASPEGGRAAAYKTGGYSTPGQANSPGVDGGRDPATMTTMTTAIRPPASLVAPQAQRSKGSQAVVPASKSEPFQLASTKIYAQPIKYEMKQVPADKITHLFYAFADVNKTGGVISFDPWADLGPVNGREVHGCVEQMYALKKNNRKLKTILSIGGWTASKDGKFDPVLTPEGRKQFAKSAVELMSDWGMDGLDIDWEYPRDKQEAIALTKLLQACREELDLLETSLNQTYHYLLTAATPAGPDKYNIMQLAEMDPFLDGWNLMAYDYAGKWDDTTGHQANLYPDSKNPTSTKFSTDKAVKDYIANNVPAHKIRLGLPLYGRAFANTAGLGKSFVGTGQPEQNEGVVQYYQLPQSEGSRVQFSKEIGSAWSFDEAKRTLVSHDTVESTQLKAAYVRSHSLGGAFFWEASGDKTGPESLVRTMASELDMLDATENQLSYPRSYYDNIRNGMVSRS
ncbi:putative chitinase [Ophiocordyceps camponoti-saundersi (nom. inval.)]|nr:putative chitinase [Ophiocordyceps camponoti-saundersi (nom. inval.)]